MNPCPKNNSSFFYYHSLFGKFPLRESYRQVPRVGSFILHLYTQSFVYKVSYIVDTDDISVSAYKSAAALRQRMLNYLQRLYLICHLTHCIRIASPTAYSLSKPVHPQNKTPPTATSLYRFFIKKQLTLILHNSFSFCLQSLLESCSITSCNT